MNLQAILSHLVREPGTFAQHLLRYAHFLPLLLSGGKRALIQRLIMGFMGLLMLVVALVGLAMFFMYALVAALVQNLVLVWWALLVPLSCLMLACLFIYFAVRRSGLRTRVIAEIKSQWNQDAVWMNTPEPAPYAQETSPPTSK